MTGYWYVATPYTKYPEGLDAAYRHANQAAAGLVRRYQIPIFCPIAHSHSLCACYGTDGGLDGETDGAFWEWFDAPLLEAAHGIAVVMMPGWDESAGVTHEIDQALRADKPVRYFTWPELDEVSD